MAKSKGNDPLSSPQSSPPPSATLGRSEQDEQARSAKATKASPGSPSPESIGGGKTDFASRLLGILDELTNLKAISILSLACVLGLAILTIWLFEPKVVLDATTPKLLLLSAAIALPFIGLNGVLARHLLHEYLLPQRSTNTGATQDEPAPTEDAASTKWRDVTLTYTCIGTIFNFSVGLSIAYFWRLHLVEFVATLLGLQFCWFLLCLIPYACARRCVTKASLENARRRLNRAVLLSVFVVIPVSAFFAFHHARTARTAAITDAQFTLRHAYTNYVATRTVDSNRIPKPYLYTNGVTVTGTDYPCILATNVTNEFGAGVLAITTNGLFVWMQSGHPPRVLPSSGYQAPLLPPGF